MLLFCSLAALLLLSSEKSPDCLQNRASRHLKRVATVLGNGRFLYCVLFLLTLLFYVDSQSYEFFALSCYAALIILVDPKRFVVASLRFRRPADPAIGSIIGVHSKNTFLAKLYALSDIEFALTGKRTKDVMLPACKTRDQVERAVERRLEGKSPKGIMDFIVQAIQPYEGGNGDAHLASPPSRHYGQTSPADSPSPTGVRSEYPLRRRNWRNIHHP